MIDEYISQLFLKKISLPFCLALHSFKTISRYPMQLLPLQVGTWKPDIKRWSITYHPNDLMMCSTNNVTKKSEQRSEK